MSVGFPVETLHARDGVKFYMVSPPGDDRGLIDYRIGAFTTKGLKIIHALSDLRGLVRVGSASQALDFVRLRTDPASAWTFQEAYGVVWFEILDWTKLPDSFGLSERPTPKEAGRYRHGYEGALTHREYQELGFRPARVTRSGAGYVIHRSIVFLDKDKTPQQVEIAELVGADGRYQVIERRPVTLPSMDGVTWDLNHPGI